MKERTANILVVDDAMILALIERILKLDDHVVSCATGSKVAIERLGERDFDLVLLDVAMPWTTEGIDIYEWIAKHKPSMAKKVVFMTAGCTVDVEELMAETGCEVIGKPFDLEDFRQRVKRKLAETVWQVGSGAAAV